MPSTRPPHPIFFYNHKHYQTYFCVGYFFPFLKVFQTLLQENNLKTIIINCFSLLNLHCTWLLPCAWLTVDWSSLHTILAYIATTGEKLHCVVCQCIVCRQTTLHHTGFNTLHYTTLHYTALLCTALHCTALYCTILIEHYLQCLQATAVCRTSPVSPTVDWFYLIKEGLLPDKCFKSA